MIGSCLREHVGQLSQCPRRVGRASRPGIAHRLHRPRLRPVVAEVEGDRRLAGVEEDTKAAVVVFGAEGEATGEALRELVHRVELVVGDAGRRVEH